MTVTIGAASFPTLTGQPFGYEGTAREGLTARQWQVTGLLTSTEWATLCSAYDTWRNARIQDADTLSSGTVGTTVAFSGTGHGQTWTSVACWFSEAPSAEQVGKLAQASVTLVDANQALAVLLREKEKQRQQSEATERPARGTVTLGGVVLTLTQPMEGFQDAPQPQLTAAGRHYLTGALGASLVRQVSGTTDAAGWASLQSWYSTITASTPAAGTWFPLGEGPRASAEVIVTGGAKATQYTVTLSLVQIR